MSNAIQLFYASLKVCKISFLKLSWAFYLFWIDFLAVPLLLICFPEFIGDSFSHLLFLHCYLYGLKCSCVYMFTSNSDTLKKKCQKLSGGAFSWKKLFFNSKNIVEKQLNLSFLFCEIILLHRFTYTLHTYDTFIGLLAENN